MQKQKILIRMPNWVGDFVMATPVLQDIRQHYASAEITVMCHSGVAPLLQNSPYIDAVFSFVRPKGKEKKTQTQEIICFLQQKQYDMGILLTNSFSSAWWFWKGDVKQRIGYNGHFRRFLLSQNIPPPRWHECQHLVITYKMMLSAVNIPLSDSAPKLFLQDKEKQDAVQFLGQRGISTRKNKIIGINPGAAYGSAKCWPPERFADLLSLLLQDPCISIIIFGDAHSAPTVDNIAERVNSKQVINLAAKTSLRQLIALISCCDLFITNDSGPMHIAAALDVPQIALFGSTSDIATRPYQEKAIVIHKHVSCSPCYLRTCPIDFKCMKQITPQEVYVSAQNILRSVVKDTLNA